MSVGGRDEQVPITGDWNIQDMVRKFPVTRKVLDRYGLPGGDGPDASLSWFARIHDVPLERLLEELNEAVRKSGWQERPGAFRPSVTDDIYQPFFLAGAGLAVLFGAFWGALSLTLMGITGGMQFGVPYGWLLAHGQSLMGGFVVLMVMGFSYQALPRFKQTQLAYPSLPLVSLSLLLTGVILQVVSHFFVPPPVFQGQNLTPSLPALIVGSVGTVFQLGAVVIFLFNIGATLGTSPKREPYDPIVSSALFWLAVSSLANILLFPYWGTVTDSPTFVQRIGSWNAPFRDAQIFGFATLMILGVSVRFFPHAYGFPSPSPRWSLLIFLFGNLALLLMAPAFPLYIPTRHTIWLGFYWLGLLIWIFILVGHLFQVRLFSRPEESDRSLKFFRLAFLWGIGGLVMGLGLPLYTVATGQSFSHNYWAAYRHTLTAGFLLLMIVGVSGKVVPILSGVDIRSANPLWTCFLLLNGGNLGRVVGQVLMDFPATTHWAGVLASVSGFIQWAGLVVWADDLWTTIAKGWALTAKSERFGEFDNITPQTRIADEKPCHRTVWQR